MRSVNIRDVATGSVFTILGLIVLYISSGLKAMPGMAVGPGFFPQLTGGGLALFGAILTLQSLFLPPPAHEQDEENEVLTSGPTWADRLFSPILLASLLALVLLMPVFGFLVSTSVFAVIVVLISGGAWPAALVFGPFITVLTWALFVYGLRVPLPVSMWG